MIQKLLFGIASFVAAGAAASAQTTLFTFNGDSAGDTFGQDVDIIGDVDGDGFADVLVGAWRDDPAGKTDAGMVKVFSGRNGATLWSIPGDLAGDHMGWRSSGAGDVNGDGFADFVAAADEADIATLANAGTAKIINGHTGGVIYTINGNAAQDLLGWSSGAAGDVDGDGRDDVVIGVLLDDAPGKTDCGSAIVISGATGLPLFTSFGDSSGDQFGYSVRRAGDVNGDGKDDIIVGAPNDDNTGSNSGSARVLAGPSGTVLYTVNGAAAGDGTGGVSVSGAGDVNLDGFADFVVGWATADGPAGADTGRVVVYSGATGAPISALALTGDTASDRLGASVRGAGDITGDGYADLVAGAPNDNGTGTVWVVSGKDGSLVKKLSGDSAGDAMGTSVAAGDVNKDGFPDVVGGAVGDDNNGSGSGSARVWSVAAAGVAHVSPGTPGCAGVQLLNGVGAPSLGNANFMIVGSNAPASSLNLLLAADAALTPGADVFGIGAVLYPDLATAAQVYALDFVADAHGSCALNVPIPNDVSFVGVTFTFQSISAWTTPCAALGPFGLSSSIAAKVTVAP